jgi:hypothetical protein
MPNASPTFASDGGRDAGVRALPRPEGSEGYVMTASNHLRGWAVSSVGMENVINAAAKVEV